MERNSDLGENENQVSKGRTSDLLTCKIKCTKNPGHEKFIPIDSFSLEYLPKSHQDIDLYKLIKAVAALTLRVAVSLTSLDRPEFVPNTKNSFFLSDMRGKKVFRTGTGTVRDIIRRPDEDNKQRKEISCPCDKCKVSGKPRKNWWEVYVITAAHLVFDNIEANHTSMRLFYDNQGSELVTIKDNVCVVSANIEKDTCLLSCVTCDDKLGLRLEESWKEYEDFWYKVSRKFTKTRDVDKTAFIVSHPHECAKRVSVGNWIHKEKWGEFVDYKFTYNTSTCPGSGGASVHCVGYSVLFIDHVHSGTASGINFSGIGAVVGADDETVNFKSKKQR